MSASDLQEQLTKYLEDVHSLEGWMLGQRP
jgi:hypothetical protein